MEKAPSAQPERVPSESIRLVDDIFLEVYSGEGSLGLELRKNDAATGKLIRTSLNEIVPGLKFKPGEHFKLHKASRSVECNLDAIHNDPREIFSLFHEMGHAITLNKRGKLYEFSIWRSTDHKESVPKTKRVAADERSAWTEGLRLARQLRDRGLDLFSLFPDAEALARWLREISLARYEKDVVTAIEGTKGEHIFGISIEQQPPPKKNKKYS